MKNTIKKGIIILFFIGIYIILSESFEPFNLAIAIITATVSLKVSSKLLGFDYAEEFYVPPVVLTWYIFYLLKEIYLAGFDMFKRIFTGDVNVNFVEHESILKDQLSLIIFSNTVTLTPGTATVARDGSKLTVLAAEKDNKSVRAGLEKMEKSLTKFEGVK